MTKLIMSELCYPCPLVTSKENNKENIERLNEYLSKGFVVMSGMSGSGITPQSWRRVRLSIEKGKEVREFFFTELTAKQAKQINKIIQNG